MKARTAIRKAWVAFAIGAALEFVYLGSEVPFVSITVDRLVAIGLFAIGAGAGLWIDAAVSSRLSRRPLPRSEAVETLETVAA